MELGRNIHLIPEIRGANTYAVLGETQAGGEGHLTLIDTGMPGNAPRIIEFLKSLGKEQIGSLTIILTHPDIDHSGSVAELKEKLGNVKVAIHEADAPRLTGEKPLKEVRGLVGLLFKAMSPFMKFKPVKPDVLLKDGEQVDGLSVIHTPGHTQGSICLYGERLKAMFAGDALRTDKNRRPKLPSATMTLNIAEAKNSIRKIASYEFELLLPGHGPPILTDASKKVKELVASLG
ncbi:MAG: MBL fold metallo-hydrolase [Candidatus Bathyarchaeia archaeon]|jgi:glyoxylase-like metal-dependent hydrolase (beta-lactamase superfamily II)